MPSKSLKKGFQPLTGEIGIPGTSYRIQLGLIDGKWASRLLKGRGVIDSYVLKAEDVEGGFLNQDLIVAWLLRILALPNINPHRIMVTVKALIKSLSREKRFFLVELKIEQIKTLESSIALREEQIKTLKNSLDIKEEKAKLTKSFSQEVNEEREIFYPELVKVEVELDQINRELEKAYEDLERLRQRFLGDGDIFPYPYIFKPPTPPGDLGVVGELQAKEPKVKDPEQVPYCKYCGGILVKGESICHVCKNKVD